MKSHDEKTPREEPAVGHVAVVGVAVAAAAAVCDKQVAVVVVAAGVGMSVLVVFVAVLCSGMARVCEVRRHCCEHRYYRCVGCHSYGEKEGVESQGNRIHSPSSDESWRG